jgi:hypothetical protein
VGRSIIVQKEKILKSKYSWTNSFERASGGDQSCLYQILPLLFFSLVPIFCSLRLESLKKIYQHGLDLGTLEF